MASLECISRLGTEIVPTNYSLLITPIFDNWTFTGFVTIDLNLSVDVYELRLHSVDLNIVNVRLNQMNATIQYDIEKEQVVLRFNELIQKGTRVLHIEYTGVLNDNTQGFSRCIYNIDSNKLGKLAFTQFEPTDARRAFPCWDEPNFKATFEITLVVPKSYTALSNMPQTSRQCFSDTCDKVTFDKTPLMSTYMLAFVVGELDSMESMKEKNLKIRVFTVKGKSTMAKFAMDVCEKMIEFYSEYFGMEYPLPKLDLFAIPNFLHCAMENWGLITFRESCLLVSDNESSVENKRSVTTFIAHECAHMWFGDLVTFDWWDDIWLREGFATWIGCYAVAHCYHGSEAWCDFAEEHYRKVMYRDSFDSSHPIQDVGDKMTNIFSYFEAISYSKAACLINMVNELITEEKFRLGMRAFILKYQYKNATSSDLWETLQEVSGVPLNVIINGWLKTTGFPLIYVRSIKNENNETVAVSMQQVRFSILDSQNGGEYWPIPITISAVNSPKKTLANVILKATGEKQIFNLSGAIGDLVRINVSGVGYYHVEYDCETIELVKNAILNNKLSNVDKIRLLGDIFMLSRSGIVPVIVLLNFIRILSSEKSYHVWHCAMNIMKTISSFIDEMDSSLNLKVNQFIANLAIPTFTQLGWEENPSESDNDKLLRALIITILGGVGNQSVVEGCIQRFTKHMSPCDANVSTNIRGAVYATVLKFGNTMHLAFLLDRLKQITNADERTRILKSLGACKEGNLPHLLQFTMFEYIGKLEKNIIFQVSATSNQKRLLLWHFVRFNWNKILKDVLEFSLDCFNGFATTDRRRELEGFFGMGSTNTLVKQLFENIDANIKFLQKDSDKLREYFLLIHQLE